MVRRTVLAAWLAAVTWSTAAAQPTIAVLPFENAGSYGKDRDEFDGLRRGLAALLTSELASTGAVRAAERDAIQKLVDERGANAPERIDLATAARIGKAVNARYTVAASFIDLYGDFRIDAQIIDVTTGEVIKVVKSDPRLADREQMFRIVGSVADRILEAAKLSDRRTSKTRNVPTEALTLYGRALLYQDRGDRQKAIDFSARAAKAFPQFREAEDLLKRLQGNS